MMVVMMQVAGVNINSSFQSVVVVVVVLVEVSSGGLVMIEVVIAVLLSP